MSEPLYMLSIELGMDGIMALGRRRKLPLRGTDTGYLVHMLLGELFGEKSPTPFAIREKRGRLLKVLGYSQSPVDTLRKHAELYSDPEVYSTCNWDSLWNKPMPVQWHSGQYFGFELRACPVVRMGSNSIKHRKGAEVDAFLQRCWVINDPVQPIDRSVVYREWLCSYLDRQGGAELVDFKLIAFMRQKLIRRSHGSNRKSHFIERPDATFRGIIKVRDGSAFRNLLGRGVGRHRAFGYGMMLLRSVR